MWRGPPIQGARHLTLRDGELEACTRLLVAVDEVAAVGARIRSGDRETETAAAGVRIALERFEEAREYLVGDAGAVVGHGDAQLGIALSCGQDDRRRSVPHRVGKEVADDPVERERVDDDAEVMRNVEP